MDGIFIIFCLALIIFLALAALVVFMVQSGNKEASQPVSQKPRRRPNQSWLSWFTYISLSLIIAIWTIWGALFFLAVVGIMRQNPEADSSHALGENEKKTARRVYVWLLFAPLLILPVFIGMLFNLDFPEAGTNVRALTTLVPLIFHVPLILGLSTKSVFVYRHTQQGILLVALRAGMASFAISIEPYPIDGFWLFLLGNGSLWLFGSLWGLHQISRGECWLMNQKGESLAIKAGEVEGLSPQVHLERSREFIGRYKAEEAKKHALAAFRSGDRDVRLQAVQLLSSLHEVEEF